MTRRYAVVLLSALLLVAPIARAQSGGAAGDPITGTWSGELTPKNGPSPVSVVFQLKFDGQTRVTGTFTGMPSPGDVKKGTFDPKSGAIELLLGKEGDTSVRITLTGKLVKDTIAGTFTGEAAGDFSLTREK